MLPVRLVPDTVMVCEVAGEPIVWEKAVSVPVALMAGAGVVLSSIITFADTAVAE